MSEHGNTGKRNAAKPAEKRVDSVVTFRVKTSDKARWVKQAQREGLKLSDWIKDRLNDCGNTPSE